MYGISKLFIIYSLIFILIKLKNIKRIEISSKNNLSNFNISSKNDDDNEESNNNNKVILYKPSINSGFNIKEVFSKIMSRYTNVDKNADFNEDKFNNFKMNNEGKSNNEKNEELIILQEEKENIQLDNINNFIIHGFQSKKEALYKIKCNLIIEGSGVNNINLIITDGSKRFVYDFLEHNDTENSLIKEYGFILDNNKFSNNNVINIYLIFHSALEKIVVNNIFFEVTEFNQSKDPNAIIIFNVSNKYYPLFSENLNILDFEEYNDKNNIFFI